MLIESCVVVFFWPFRAIGTLLWRVYCSTVLPAEGRYQRKGDKAGKNPPATAMGRYFKPELSQNLKNSCSFFQRHPINYIFRHVVAEFGLHSSNFLREKRSSSPPGRFQTMICSKVRGQRNSKHALHFKLANQRFAPVVRQGKR